MVNIKKKKRSIITLLISIVTILIFCLSASYALLKWTSSSNTNVNFDSSLGIIYNRQHETLTGTLNASTDKSGGLTTQIELWTTTTKTSVYGTLSLNITSIASELAIGNILKWEVWSNNVKINDGTFDGSVNGSSIDLMKDVILSNSQTFYNVYIWLDDNLITNTNASGKTITASVSASASQVP